MRTTEEQSMLGGLDMFREENRSYQAGCEQMTDCSPSSSPWCIDIRGKRINARVPRQFRGNKHRHGYYVRCQQSQSVYCLFIPNSQKQTREQFTGQMV